MSYANPAFGVQATGGSTSIRGHYEQLRRVGADVETLLLEAAAQQLNVKVSSLSTDDGHIVSNGSTFHTVDSSKPATAR